MPSEYDIYRAYSGMNRSKSRFDTFTEGLKEIQAGARADRQLDLQERAQERQDKTLKFNQDQTIESRARQKETDKMDETKFLISMADKPYQQAQILKSRGYPDLAKNKMDEYERGVDLGSVYNQSWEGSPIDQLGVLGEYLSNANPEDKFYQDAKSRRGDLLEEIKTTDEEILADIEFGGQYQNAFNLLTSPASDAKERQAGKDELIRLEDAFSKKTGESYKKATQRKSILPKEAEDLNESNATSILEGGTDDRLFKEFDDMDEDEKVETGDASKEPDTKVVSAGMGRVKPDDVGTQLSGFLAGLSVGSLSKGAQKLVGSKKYDISKIGDLSKRQRINMVSNILGRKVSPTEETRLFTEIRTSGIGKDIKSGIKLASKYRL